MSKFKYPNSFKGQFLGLFILVILQFLNGVVHVAVGTCLILIASGDLVYNFYTFLYGFFNIVFGYGLWSLNKSGYFGTIVLSIFIIIVDISAVLSVSLIAGVPKVAAFGEIIYSICVITYLFQPKILRLFLKAN